MYWILVLAFVVSEGADLPPMVRCGTVPSKIFECMGNPKILPHPENVDRNCGILEDCERTECTFMAVKWIEGYEIDKTKIAAYYDQYAQDEPLWAPAAAAAKNCLAKVLRPQGILIGCEAYDITLCGITAFFRNVNSSKWSKDRQCKYSRQFVDHCPVCPTACFNKDIPAGTCEACKDVPKQLL